MGRFFDILMWTIVAAMLVLIIMNAGGTAQIISTFFSGWTKETSILTGTGYQTAK